MISPGGFVAGRPDVPAIAPSGLPDDALLLDVREPEEWVAGHAPDAWHIPLADLPSRVDEIPRERRVVAVCRSGGRSARATAWLAEQGYDAVNLDGGMTAWSAAGRPMVSETGAPPTVA